MNTYKVTIGIPIYNTENYVERSLLSALNQTFPSIEYIVVDDKGTDNSMQVVHRIIAEHPRGYAVRIIDHVTNRTLGAVRNTCIDNCTTPYLFFMDSDDALTPDCIETLYNAMMDSPVDFVAASHKYIACEDSPFATANLAYAAVYPDKIIKNGESSGGGAQTI